MSGRTTPWMRQVILTAALHRTVMPFTSFLVCLTLRVPAANAATNQLNEPTINGYGRARVHTGSTNWRLSGTQMVNSGRISFPRPGGTGWGTLHGWALIAEGLNRVAAVGEINEPYRVLGGYQPILEPGAIVWGLDD